MAESSGESWCIVFPDLQSAPRILHASQLGRCRCGGAAGHAAQQSPETKRHYQLGMVDQVREGIEQANERAYQDKEVLRSYYGGPKSEKVADQKSVSS